MSIRMKIRKIMICVCVFVVSATEMSEATQPVREYYRKVYDDVWCDFAMIVGLIISMLL